MVKNLIRGLTPPILWNFLRTVCCAQASESSRDSEYSFVSYNWQEATVAIAPRGWNEAGVLEFYEQSWDEFLRRVVSDRSLDFTPETMNVGVMSWYARNVINAFGYALSRAARGQTQLSILDWGGGFGHYYYIAKRLLPEIDYSYTVQDLPGLVQAARKKNTLIRFLENTDPLIGSYDFVIASGAIHYVENWREQLGRLLDVCKESIFLTRLPSVLSSRSFVAVQRPSGYMTEYLGWVLNASEVISFVEQQGFALAQELCVEPVPRVSQAPEQPINRGYLFFRGKK